VVDPVTVSKLWLLVKPWKRFQNWRARRKGTSVKWLKSRTIQGIAASGVALLLGLFVGDADAASLSAQVTAWLLDGVQLGGLIFAAHGRKNAAGPL
jgi:hypothetical protein